MTRNPEQQREIDALRAALRFTRKLNARLFRQNTALRKRQALKPPPQDWLSSWENKRNAEGA